MKSRSNEAKVLKNILMKCSKGFTRLFRNNVGLFKTRDGRMVKTGLCKGSSDLVGWTTIKVHPEMVGMELAIFTAIEVKDKGKPTKEQLHFIDVVHKAGGIAGIARSVEDAEAILHGE